jgi:hypothetical protein
MKNHAARSLTIYINGVDMKPVLPNSYISRLRTTKSRIGSD